MRACLFCDGLPLTREHVFPQWLRHFSGPQSFISRAGSYQPAFPESVVRRNAQGEYVEVVEYRGKKAPNLHEVTVKAVCATCNNGWMSALETAVAVPLKKMANPPSPAPHLVNPQVKRLLAAWAFKCFLMYDQYRDSRDRVFVKRDYVEFERTKLPPRTARIYMGLTNSPNAGIGMWHEAHLLNIDPTPDSQIILATKPRNLAGSYLGFQGVYFIQQFYQDDINWNPAARKSIEIPARIAVEETPVHQIWPQNNKALHWPPQLASHEQFHNARLGLFRVMDRLPKMARKVDGPE